MPRETVAEKARRYVSEGRLLVEHVDAARVTASCRGNGAVYELGWRDGDWYCDCPARTSCAHLHALWLVTVRSRHGA